MSLSSDAFSARRHLEKQSNGTADTQALASAAAAGSGILAVVTKAKKHRQTLHLHMLQVYLCIVLLAQAIVAMIDQTGIFGHALVIEAGGGMMCLRFASKYYSYLGLHTLHLLTAAGQCITAVWRAQATTSREAG